MSCNSITCSHTKDRISDLPDEIILQIVSFMEAKTAVRTGILSKRFAYFWTHATRLNFELPSMDSIYSTIRSHNRCNLEKVSVNLCHNGAPDPDGQRKFGSFIRLVSLANVKELVIDFGGAYYTLPQYFCSNHSLKKLTLKDCYIDIKRFSFSDYLSTEKLFEETINGVLSGCPSLELLELSKIWRCSRINLTNNKCLRKLLIDCYYGVGMLEIVAPNLQSLVLSGFMCGCKVLNAKSLTACFLDFYSKCDFELDSTKKLISLLNDLSHVEDVTIGEWVLQVLFFIEFVKIPCPMFKAVKCLQIRTTLTKDDMAGIECLLRNLNRLETLSIELYDYDEEYFLILLSGKDRGCKSPWTSKNMQNKVDLKLKNVKVCNLVADMEFQYDEVLLLAKFLLKNSNIMENMTISASGSDHCLLKFTNTLLEFPRSSPCAVVKIEGWKRY